MNLEKMHLWGYPIIMFVSLGLYFILRLNPAIDITIADPMGHFYIVTIVSILALVVAVLVGISSIKLRNIGVTLLSLAFISLAEVFSVHGLSTPGLMMGMSRVPGIASEISVTLTALWLWLSSISSDHPVIVRLSQWQRVLVWIWVTGVGAVFTVMMMMPKLAEAIPVDLAPTKWITATITLLFTTMTSMRYGKSFRYSRLPLPISIVYSAGLLSIAQIIIVTGQIWKLSWWLYHVLLLVSVIIVVVGVLRQYATGQPLSLAIRGLFTSNPIERIEAGISPSVRTLIVATEAKDEYTAGHNFRVALYALRLGEELGISPSQLRALAQGAVIHDVGKIEVPDAVLNKPGKLTTEERTLIEKHPVTGYDMCKRLGFMKDELDIIRSHHEKWDGTGYPDRLSGHSIPKLARIVAIADVYDALTSSRSYRAAWSHDDAMQLIIDQASKHFDPECVLAWKKLNEREIIRVENPEWVHYSDANAKFSIAQLT